MTPMADAASSPALRAAIEYADLGWHVVPCQPRGKEPLYDLVPHAVKDSSNDPEIIAAWFRRHPNANLAVRCGRISGLVVLDVDPRSGGSESLARLIAEHGPLPDTVTCHTGGDGVHFYFKHPGTDLETWKADGIELRAEDVYVVAPPSIHPTGLDYRWTIAPGTHPLAELPEHLRKPRRTRATLGLVVPSRTAEEQWAGAALEAECSDLASCPSGNRNNRLNEAAFNLGQIVGSGFLSRIVVENRLLDAAHANGSLEDDGESKTRGTIRSGIEAGLKEPRYPKDWRGPPSAPRTTARVEVADTPATDLAPVYYLDLAVEPPPVPWIVHHWLVKHDLGILSASAGAGKSTLMADLAIALSHGRQWCGSLVPLVTGKVLYFDEEQSRGTLLRMFRALGAEPHPNLLVASCQGMVLSTPAGFDRLRREIDTHEPVLVVLDTVSQVFAGVDLASLEEVTEVFARLTLIRNEYEAAFMMPTHNRKVARDSRGTPDPLEAVFGSVAFGARTDTVWNARRNGNALEVFQTKRREKEREYASMRVAYTRDDDGRVTLTNEGAMKLADTLQGGAEIAMVQALRNQRIMTTAELREVGVKSGATVTTSRRALEQLVKLEKIASTKRGFYTLKEGDFEPDFEQGDFLS